MEEPLLDFNLFFLAGGPQIFTATGDTNFQLIIVDFMSTDLDIAAELNSSRIPRLAVFFCSTSFVFPPSLRVFLRGVVVFWFRWKLLTVGEVFSRSQGLQVGIDYVEVSAVLLWNVVHQFVCVCVCVCVSGVRYAHFYLHRVFHSPDQFARLMVHVTPKFPLVLNRVTSSYDSWASKEDSLVDTHDSYTWDKSFLSYMYMFLSYMYMYCS